MTIVLDVCVTGTVTSARARLAQERIADIIPLDDANTLWNFRVLFLATGSGTTEDDEREWLLRNVVTAPVACVVAHASLETLRTSIFIRIARSRRSGQHVTLDALPGLATYIPDTTVLHAERPRILRPVSNTFIARPPRLALLIPVHKNTSMTLSILAPSLQTTLAKRQMQCGVVFGVVDGDPPRDNDMITLCRRFERSLKIPVEGVLPLPASWFAQTSFARGYSALFEHAMMCGYDFALQLRDSYHLDTPGWDTKLGSYLCSNPGGVGVVGMQERTVARQFDASMVSRLHYDIFGFLTPPDTEVCTEWFQTCLAPYAHLVTRATYTNTTSRKIAIASSPADTARALDDRRTLQTALTRLRDMLMDSDE